MNHMVTWRKKILGRGSSQCKDPDMRKVIKTGAVSIGREKLMIRKKPPRAPEGPPAFERSRGLLSTG